LEIPRQKADLISAAVELGFEFHHCQAEYLMLTYRLVAGSFLPPYATHYAGVGGVVLNEAQELLVVVEQADRENRPNYYKLPGGALQPGEHIVAAAIREVQEETGVDTRFESLVCIRHWHQYRYGKSDLYFVCRLSPLASQITVQPSEIYKCEWMAVAEFLEKESVGVFSKRIVECALQGKGLRSGRLEGYDQDPKMRELLLSA
jgi:8-oxo-dGTP pyrophosphatase MutT (NUDIX family)